MLTQQHSRNLFEIYGENIEGIYVRFVLLPVHPSRIFLWIVV